MAEFDKAALVGMFPTETKEVEVKAFGGNPVTIQKLTVKQANEVEALAFDDVEMGENPVAKYKINEAFNQKVLKASFMMVTPKMKVEELDALPESAKEGIIELNDLYDAWVGKPKKSNSKTKSTSKEK